MNKWQVNLIWKELLCQVETEQARRVKDLGWDVVEGMKRGKAGNADLWLLALMEIVFVISVVTKNLIVPVNHVIKKSVRNVVHK